VKYDNQKTGEVYFVCPEPTHENVESTNANLDKSWPYLIAGRYPHNATLGEGYSWYLINSYATMTNDALRRFVQLESHCTECQLMCRLLRPQLAATAEAGAEEATIFTEEAHNPTEVKGEPPCERCSALKHDDGHYAALSALLDEAPREEAATERDELGVKLESILQGAAHDAARLFVLLDNDQNETLDRCEFEIAGEGYALDSVQKEALFNLLASNTVRPRSLSMQSSMNAKDEECVAISDFVCYFTARSLVSLLTETKAEMAKKRRLFEASLRSIGLDRVVSDSWEKIEAGQRDQCVEIVYRAMSRANGDARQSAWRISNISMDLTVSSKWTQPFDPRHPFEVERSSIVSL